jgi:hypothetical protein
MMHSQQPNEQLVRDLLELAKTAEQHMRESGEALTALADKLQPSPNLSRTLCKDKG